MIFEAEPLAGQSLFVKRRFAGWFRGGAASSEFGELRSKKRLGEIVFFFCVCVCC